jgi:hypothetical protein
VTTPANPLGTSTIPTPKIPTTAVKPPKIPLAAQTPTTTTPSEETGGKTSEETKSGTGTGGSEPKPKPLLLDTNAAQTYNPYGYDAALFGDPSLTIDGDKTTAWTAQLNPETSPRLAEGVLIDVNAAKKLSSLALDTASPGMTVQVYGANGKTVPPSITDPGWVTLSHAIVIHKKHAHIKLAHKQAFVFIALWISRAGEKSVGTATAPGHVSVNEIELFPFKSG